METDNVVNVEKDMSYLVLITLRKIIRSMDMHSRQLVKNYGLTSPQLMILKEISASTDITIGAVARKVSLSQATVTNIIDRLEVRGMVERERSSVDKRRVIVRITDKTREILRSKPSLMQEAFLNSFQMLKPWEQSLILSSTQRIAAMMGADSIELAGDFESDYI